MINACAKSRRNSCCSGKTNVTVIFQFALNTKVHNMSLPPALRIVLTLHKSKVSCQKVEITLS